MAQDTVLITLKNYRCFADGEPARIRIQAGVLAFVGPNNSGKSSLLRFFYELRPLFEAFRNRQSMLQLAGGSFSTPYLGVEDHREIFSDSTRRPLSIELEFNASKSDEVSRVKLFAEPDSPTVWRAEFRFGPGDLQAARMEGAPDGQTIRYYLAGSQSPFMLNLQNMPMVLGVLAGAFYVGPFRNAISEGGGAYYDLSIGTDFIKQWDQWKNAGDKTHMRAIQQVTEDIAAIFDYQRLEINAAQSATRLQIVADGRPYRLRELGAGISQFIVLLGNLAVKRPPLLLIDEPELNLHPRLQTRFISRLEEYASYGLAFATHSIGLARTSANRIMACMRDGDHSIIRDFEAVRSLPELVGELSFSAYRELGYDLLLLVEGVTDVKVVQQWLRLLHGDHKAVVVPLGGSAMITSNRNHELQELGRLANRVAVLIDSERSSAGEALAPERSAFLADCTAQQFLAHATDYRAIDNYLPDHAIKAAFGESKSALAPFESLATRNNGWAKAESWRAAKLMTKDELSASDVGQFLGRIFA